MGSATTPVLGAELSGEGLQPLLAAGDEDDRVAREASSPAIAVPIPADAPVTRAVLPDGSGSHG